MTSGIASQPGAMNRDAASAAQSADVAPRVPAPRLVATVGMHASASTWVFNVVRELLIAAHGDQQVLAVYADEPSQLPDADERDGRVLLIKSHHGSSELDRWLAEAQALGFFSVRDPRDACMSMSQRFGAPLGATVRWIANDCNRLLRLLAAGQPVLRYEDRFFEQPALVGHIAQALGLELPTVTLDAVFARYRTEAVRAYAAGIAQLPPERVMSVNGFPMDRVTQILAPHVGDTRVGKWRDLPEPVQGELTRIFRPFLLRFGYADAR